MAMSNAQKNSLVAKRVALINSVIPNEELCGYLRQANHITDSMEQELMLETITKRRVGKLLDMLSRRSAKAFDAFLHALVMTDQEHAAEMLDRNKTMELVQRRDAERGQSPIAQASTPSSSREAALAPSGSAVVTSSSAAQVPSSSANAVPCSSPSHSAGCSTSFAGSNVYAGTSQPSSLPPPIQAMDTDTLLSYDVSDVTDAVIDNTENLSLVENLSPSQASLNSCPDDVIKKGYAVVIQNTEYCEKAYASPVNSFVVVQFFKKCGFETDIVTNNSAQGLKTYIQNLRGSDVLRRCDAFALFFMGFGDYGGQLFGTDGQSVSIKTDILQNFNTDNCPALRGKPKILCFQMARTVSSGEAPMLVDSVDGGMKHQLATNTTLWSDMIIFSSVTPTSSSFDHSNFMHRAMILVANKFAHELSVWHILKKVEEILKCQKVTTKVGSSNGIHVELHCSPEMKPVYLKLAKS